MPPPAKSRILCVDDNAEWLTLLERLLRQHDYEVVAAHGSRKGMELLGTLAPDLILLDVQMPEMDGYEFCTKLQSRPEFSLTPVVFLTSLDSEHDKAKALAAGGVDHVSKNADKDVILQAIRRHLATRAHWNAALVEKKTSGPDFPGFRTYLLELRNASPEMRRKVGDIPPAKVYSMMSELGLSSGQIAQHMALYLGLSYVPALAPEDVELGVLPTSFCKSNRVVALKASAGQRVFALDNPFQQILLDELRRFTDPTRPVRLMVASPETIAGLFDINAQRRAQAAPARPSTVSEIERELQKQYRVEERQETLPAEANEASAPTIQLVNKLIDNAIEAGASDIHIEPWEGEVTIRYRVDGDLRVVGRLRPARLINPIVARLKIMSSLNITERRLPQDGRVMYKDDIDLRVAITPMHFGEKVVLRLLIKKKSALRLERLGFSDRHLRLYREKLQTPYGFILHVGPTGSGKSMTLFSALQEIQKPDINIQTIEDPIEYTLPGINQLQIHHEIGLTFGRALRSFLRQDPDVILVGEIRDAETCQVAVEAAMTGHLLLSTLHTNDAASTLTRFIELGIEPFLVSSTIILVCAQRLLRMLCLECKETYEPSEPERRLSGSPAGQRLARRRPGGCPACQGSGYKGRVGTHEILVVDALREAITRRGTSSDALKRMAVERAGMTTLYWDAMEKARQGITSIEEVLGQVRKDDFDSRPEWMFQELGLERPVDRDRPPF